MSTEIRKVGKLIKLSDESNAYVSDNKKSYILNIVNSAGQCDIIDKIVLFGSALEERCNDDSDIDIAVFGNKTKYNAMRSKKYLDFTRRIYDFGEFQDYDIIYFPSDKTHDLFLSEIEKGQVIYSKKG